MGRLTLLVLLAAALALGGRARAELAVGTTLDKSNADQAKDLLPPEILSHYQKGEYTNKIVDFPDSAFQWDDGYAEASAQNAKNLVLDADKQPVDRTTNKRPDYIMGHPFPEIREDDPDAAVKVLWNTIYTVYTGGNSRNVTNLDWVSPTRIERESGQDVTFLYYDGQPKQYSPPNNPDNLLFQFISLSLTPADLQGTAALSWRYKDPSKRDANWAYVPSLRRVRAVSPANRSDGFLGSDISQDDGNFFDGKPEDFTWRLVGRRDALRMVDPYSIKGEGGPLTPVPGGGWRQDWPQNLPAAGFQKDGWKGVGWA